ncbi:conserved hypothetical protein, secreted [Candidatus Magnetomorum sp. HK-1]|nr:conserved hypothetical protein, secreted [Candidatus Magnetomorum sp. HK-1]
MKQLSYTFSILMTMLFVLNSLLFAASDWRAEIKKNGIDAYSRIVEGTDILEIRAITVVEARMEVIAEVLRDIPANVEWRPKCAECRLLERHNRNAMTTYTRIDLPWPVSDRDVVIKADTSINLNTGRVVVSLGSVDHHKAPKAGSNVRITEFFSQYYLEYINREQTGIIFTTRVNPAGRIPTFLANMFNKRFAYEEMLGLINMVKRQKYIEAGKRSEDRHTIENLLQSEEKVKRIFKARLDSFIKDKKFVELLATDEKVLKVFGQGSGEIEKLILYGMGLRESKKKAIQKLLKVHLKNNSEYRDEMINEIASDDLLITAILDGKRKDASFDVLLQDAIKRKIAFKK